VTLDFTEAVILQPSLLIDADVSESRLTLVTGGVVLPGRAWRTAFAVCRSDRAGLTRGGRVAWRVGNTDPLAFPERVFLSWVDWHAGAYATKTSFCCPG
jgi:hypothetical protein